MVVDGLRPLVGMALEAQSAAATQRECDFQQNMESVSKKVARMVEAAQARRSSSETDDASIVSGTLPTTASGSGVLLVRVVAVSNLPMPARSQCCHLTLRLGSQCSACRPLCASTGGAAGHEAYLPVHRFRVEANRDIRLLEITVQSSASVFGHVLVDLHGLCNHGLHTLTDESQDPNLDRLAPSSLCNTGVLSTTGENPNHWYRHTCTLEDVRTGQARKGDVTFEVNFVYDPFDPSAEALVRRFENLQPVYCPSSQTPDKAFAKISGVEDKLLEDLSAGAPANIITEHLWQAVRVRSQQEVEKIFRNQLNTPASLKASLCWHESESRQAALARRAFARQARLARPLNARRHTPLPEQGAGQDEEHEVAMDEDLLHLWPSTAGSTRASTVRDPMRPLLPWIIQELKDPRDAPLFTSRRQARASAVDICEGSAKSGKALKAAAALEVAWEEVARKRQEDRETYARPWRLQQPSGIPSPSLPASSPPLGRHLPSRLARLQPRLHALLEELGKALQDLHTSMQKLGEQDQTGPAATIPTKRLVEISRRLDVVLCIFQDFSSQVEVLQVIIQQVENMVRETSITGSVSKQKKGVKQQEEAWEFCAGLAQLQIMGTEAAWQAQLNLRDLRAEEDALSALLFRELTPLTSTLQDYIATRPASALQIEFDELDGEVLETFGSAVHAAASICAAAGLETCPGDPVSSSTATTKNRWAPVTVSVKAAAKKWEVASPRLLRWARSSPVPAKLPSRRQASMAASSHNAHGHERRPKRRVASPALPTLPGQKVYMKRGMSGWVHVADSIGDHAHPPSSWPAAHATPHEAGSVGADGAASTSAPSTALPQLGSRLWTPGGGPGAWPLSPSLLQRPRLRDYPDDADPQQVSEGTPATIRVKPRFSRWQLPLTRQSILAA